MARESHPLFSKLVPALTLVTCIGSSLLLEQARVSKVDPTAASAVSSTISPEVRAVLDEIIKGQTPTSPADAEVEEEIPAAKAQRLARLVWNSDFLVSDVHILEPNEFFRGGILKKVTLPINLGKGRMIFITISVVRENSPPEAKREGRYTLDICVGKDFMRFTTTDLGTSGNFLYSGPKNIGSINAKHTELLDFLIDTLMHPKEDFPLSEPEEVQPAI